VNEAGQKVLKTEVQLLPCPLTKEELLTAGNRLALIEQELVKAEEEMAQTRAEHKEGVEKLEEERGHLAQCIRTRQEMRNVEVEVRAMFPEGIAQSVRLDNGQVVEERRLESWERQEGIEFAGPGSAEDGEKKEAKSGKRRGGA
jgi:hypothetical protein